MKRIMITDRLVSLVMAVSVFLTLFTGSKNNDYRDNSDHMRLKLFMMIHTRHC